MGLKENDSYYNDEEMKEVADILIDVLYQDELSLSYIGIISPYSAQVSKLRQFLGIHLPLRLPRRKLDFEKVNTELDISSVDSFQGSEKELIIFSAVRSNNQRRVGFLSDWRRLNVMITRARRGLIVVGNLMTLSGDEWWSHYIDWARQSGY